jgi:hypothetical protein
VKRFIERGARAVEPEERDHARDRIQNSDVHVAGEAERRVPGTRQQCRCVEQYCAHRESGHDEGKMPAGGAGDALPRCLGDVVLGAAERSHQNWK